MSFHRTVGTKTVLMYCYVDDLKQRLISVWAEFKQSVIYKAIDQWQPRLVCSCTLNNWLIEITVCFYKDTFFVRTSNLKANIHIVPFQSVKNSYFKFLQGDVATLFRWNWKMLAKALHINFYQNRSSMVEVIIKNHGMFVMPHSEY